jgi:hypothetical protein
MALGVDEALALSQWPAVAKCGTRYLPHRTLAGDINGPPAVDSRFRNALLNGMGTAWRSGGGTHVGRSSAISSLRSNPRSSPVGKETLTANCSSHNRGAIIHIALPLSILFWLHIRE